MSRESWQRSARERAGVEHASRAPLRDVDEDADEEYDDPSAYAPMQRWAVDRALQRDEAPAGGETGLDAAVEAAHRASEAGAAGADGAAAPAADGAVSDEPVGGAAAPAPEAATPEATAAAVEAPASEQAVPAAVRGPIERRFGVDLSDVRVLVDERPAQVGALAFAQGREIHVSPQAWDPDSRAGRELLGHELTHIVQQQTGRVAAGPGGINDDPALEAEADHVGGAEVEGGAEAPAREPAPDAPAAGPAPASPDATLAPVAGAVQRKVTVQRGDAHYHSAASLEQLSVDRLLSYVREQLDWAKDLDDADAGRLRAFITRLAANPALANGCGDFAVGEVMAALGGADAAALEKYSQAVSSPRSPPTARIDRVDTLAAAKELGAAVLALEGAVGGTCLYHISTPETVRQLVVFKLVDAFVEYVKVQQPVLHATEGDELHSFFLTRGFGVDLIGLRGDLPKIRNLHRFQPLALWTLAANFKDTSKTRPLTVILHSAIDHNGAFHQDPNLTQVILDPRYLTLMIEGATSLDAVTGEIDGLAQTYGRGGKIAQVMIAGHGGPRGIQLAGTAVPAEGLEDGAEPEMVEETDSVDLDSNPEKADALFDALLRNLDSSASGRMVFNACLTGSTDVFFDPLAAEPAEVQIASALKNSPNLTEYLRQRAAAAGVAADVRGANGSFGQVGLADDADGRLNIISPGDPALTASKADYIQHGMEPEGVMRAVLEMWTDPAGAATKPEWLVRVEKRLASPPTGWPDAIIASFFGLIRAKYTSTPSRIQAFAAIAHSVSVVGDESEAKPYKIEPLVHQPDALVILADLERSPDFTDLAEIVLLQAWARLSNAKDGALLAVLGAGSVSDLERHVDTARLGEPVLARLFAAGAGDRRGQYVLALIDRFSASHAASRQFLLRELGADDEFDRTIVDDKLLGNRDADSALETIGRGPLVTTGKQRSGDRVEDANLDLDGDLKNETYAEPVQRPGVVVNCSVLRVRARPSMDADTVHYLHAGDEVFVIGHYKGWDVIMYDNKPAFVGASFIAR